MKNKSSGIVAANDNSPHRFYVYAWLYPCGRPFYVGKGNGSRDARPKSNKIFKRIVAKIGREGGDPRVVRWQDGLHEEDAHSLEVAYIKLFGRRDLGTGILCNMTNGGEGTSGIVRSEETRANMSVSQKGKTLTEEHRSKLSAARAGIAPPNKGKSPTEDARAKMTAAATGRKVSEETRAKMSAARKGRSPGNKGRPHTEAARSKIIEAHTGRKRSAESRSNMSKSQRATSPNAANVSGFKGVSLDKRSGKFRATIYVNGKNTTLGSFRTSKEAAMAYDAASIDARGVGNCYLNFPEEFRGIRQEAS